MNSDPRGLMLILVLLGLIMPIIGLVAVAIRGVALLMRVKRMHVLVSDEQIQALEASRLRIETANHLILAHVARIQTALANCRWALTALRLIPAMKALIGGVRAVRALFAADISL